VRGLLERSDDLATLRGWFDDARRGSGRLVLVAGEAGAGKSVLVQAFCDSVAGESRTLTGWCDPLATPRPAGPLVDMAHGLGEHVSSVLRHEGRSGLFDAVYAELAEAERPTVLVFEDVHWADDTTLDMLRFLGRRVGTLSCLIVATYRDDETGPAHPLRSRLGDLASHRAVSRLALAPLSLEAVTALASGTALDPRTVWTRTSGNAFFVTELLMHGASEDVPVTVADAVLARTGRLSSAARHALVAAAVAGPRSEPSVLLDVPGVDAAAVEECIDAGLLRLAPPVFTFRHELVRQAVLAVTAGALRRQLSAQVLAILRSRSPDEDMLARLAELAEDAADRDAVIELAAAAARRAAGLGSHREAAAQYARVRRFVSDGESLAEVLEALSVEQYLTGALAAAIGSREEALVLRRHLGQQHRIGDDLRWLSRLQWYAGNRVEGERLAAEALEVLAPLGAGPERAMAMSLRSQLLMLGSDQEEAIAWGTRAVAIATELGLPEVVAHALNNIGSARVTMGDPSGLEEIGDSLSRSLALNAEDHAARAYVNLAFGLVGLRLADRAEVVIEEGLAYCASHDLDLQSPYLRASRALMNVHRGRWAEARAESTQILADPVIAPVHRFVTLLPLTLVTVRSGGAADALMEELGGIAHDLDEVQRLAPYACVRAEAAWLAGKDLSAGEELMDIYVRTTRCGDRRDQSELGAWLCRLGLGAEVSASCPVGPFRDAPGQPGRAARRLQALGCEYDAAVCLTDGDEADVRRALETFARLGAAPAVAVAQARLRHLGATSIPRGPRTRTRLDADGLTPRQQQVLDLVADRLTNAEIARRLFLSERTVEHHISAALAKLGARTRADAVRQRGG
jgi:DNA-binding CsgD family transcriptional regulator